MKITLTTAQSVALAKGIAPAISKDKYHLQSVQIITTGECVTFTATDGYRMHRITVPQTDCTAGDKFTVLGSELCATLLATAKAIGKGTRDVVIEYDLDGVVEITDGRRIEFITETDIEFPECAAILDVNVETESGACYDTVYLAEIVTAAGHVSGKAKKNAYDDSQLVKIENIHPRKPMHVTAQSTATGMQFHGVLMPRRAN
jgi:DNA polymerase III sliding clamp (beta) subunit (PCNA family)